MKTRKHYTNKLNTRRTDKGLRRQVKVTLKKYY